MGCDCDDEQGQSTKLDQRLLEARTVLLFGEINQKVAREVAEKLLIIARDGNGPIFLFINSQGGHVESGDTIFDMVRFIKPKVYVIGTGWVASAAAMAYMSVPLEQRFSLPNTRYMLHQPSGGVGGQATDISIEADEIVKMKRRVNQTIAEQTKQPVEEVKKKTDRNFWMTAKEAKDFGLVGTIINDETELPKQ